MKIILICSVFISLTRHFVATRNFISPNQIFQEILTATKPRDVKFITQDFLRNKEAIVTEIYKTVLQRILTSCIGLNDSIPTELPSIRSSSASLILYVFISKNSPNSLETENIVRVIALDLHRPKVLLITILNTRDNNFESLLKSMWGKRILRVMILDLHLIDEKIIGITVHQYNPYTKLYTKESYHPQMEWFPNKIKDLYGYPVKVDLLGRLEHNNLTKDSEGRPLNYTGPDSEALTIIKRSLNFTLFRCKTEDVPPDLLRPNNALINKVKAFKSAECEMLITSVPRTEYTMDDLLEHTLPVVSDDWCPVTPITYKLKGVEAQHFMGIALLIVIVSIFWMLSILLKFEKSVWQPLYIFGALLSIAFTGNPVKHMERVAFLIIFFISYIYASNLYANLTTMNIDSQVENEYRSFQDIYESELIPLVSVLAYNLTFNTGSLYFRKLQEKAIATEHKKRCISHLIKFKNISCFMEETLARQYIHWHGYNGIQNAKINKHLCFWKLLTSFMFRKDSPYFEKVNDIQLRIEASGMRLKWYERHITSAPLNKNVTENDETQSPSLHWNLLYIAACGYVLAFLVFLGELLVYSMKKKKIQREKESDREKAHHLGFKAALMLLKIWRKKRI